MDDYDYDPAVYRVVEAAREWVRAHADIIRLAAPGSPAALAARYAATVELRAAVDALDAQELVPVIASRPVRGEVGTLTGPPIMGTNDSINAGPAKLPRGKDYDSGMAALSNQIAPHPFRAMLGSTLCIVCSATLGAGPHTFDADSQR